LVAADPKKMLYSTLGVALAILCLLTLVIAPFRLPLLLIPGTFLLAAYGMGLLLERATAPWLPALPSYGPTFSLVVRLGTGMSLLGCATALFGLLGLYRFSGLVVIAALAFGILHLVRSRRTLQLFTPTYPSLVSGLALGIVWAIAWLWATIPPTFYDELVYHLPIPQYALRSGHLPAFPWLFFSFMPHLSDLLLGWGLAFGGEIGARAMHFTFWLAIWVAGWALAEAIIAPRFCSWIGYLMAGAFASSGTFLFLGTLPFAETSLTFAVLASTAIIVQPGPSALWLPLGLLWGLAISVKLSGWLWVIAGVPAALMLRWPVSALAKSGLVMIAMTLPWWGRAWSLTGNPIYPLAYRWLGGLYWTDTAQSLLQQDLPSQSDPLNSLSLLHLPYDMVMTPERFGSASDCGPLAVGMMCLMLSFPLWPFVFNLDDVKRRQCYAAGLFLLFAGYGWVLTSTTTRFFAPAIMVALTTLVALMTLLPKPALAFSLAVLSAAGTWGTARFLSLHDQVFSSTKVALEEESRTDFMRRTLDQYEAAMYVRGNLPPEAHLLFIGESRSFYFDRTSVSPYPYQEHPLTRWVQEANSPQQLLDTLRGEGFTHVVLNTQEFRRLHAHYHVLEFTGPNALAQDHTLKQLPGTMIPLFSKNNVYVFEIPVPHEIQ
jgi:hypothetical protein